MSLHAHSQTRRRLMLGAIASVLVAAGCAAEGRARSTGQFIDDGALTTKVKTALLNDAEVSGLKINVNTYKGEVQLSGYANNERERARAAEVARSVEGVQSVRNDIALR